MQDQGLVEVKPSKKGNWLRSPDVPDATGGKQ